MVIPSSPLLPAIHFLEEFEVFQDLKRPAQLNRASSMVELLKALVALPLRLAAWGAGSSKHLFDCIGLKSLHTSNARK